MIHQLNIKAVKPVAQALYVNHPGLSPMRDGNQTLELWHNRLCHLHPQIDDPSNGLCSWPFSPPIVLPLPFVMVVPQENYIRHIPVHNERIWASAPGLKFHGNICGPMQVASLAGARYHVIYSGFGSVFCIAQN